MNANAARIVALESQLRTLKRLFYGTACLLLAGVAVAATNMQGIPDVIQAKKFEVVNKNGKPVAQLGADEDGGIARVFGNNREEVVVLSASKSGGVLNIKSKAGSQMASITSSPEGAILSTHNGQGKVLVLMGGNDRGSGAIQTRNNKGNTLVSLGTNTGGGGRVLTEDGKGEVTSESP